MLEVQLNKTMRGHVQKSDDDMSFGQPSSVRIHDEFAVSTQARIDELSRSLSITPIFQNILVCSARMPLGRLRSRLEAETVGHVWLHRLAEELENAIEGMAWQKQD